MLLAASAIPIWVEAQNIYKCGSSYSQTPCAGGQVLNVDDARSPAQQQQTQEATNNAKKLADQLKKQRLAQEKQAVNDARQSMKKEATPNPPATTAFAKVSLTKTTQKKQRAKTQTSENFTAEVPGAEK